MPLTLYLYEEHHDWRTEADGFHDRVDIYVTRKPRHRNERASIWSAKITGKKTFSDDELKEVVTSTDRERTLFERFGITDRQPKYGLPRGPFYTISEEVHEALERYQNRILNIST